MGNNNRVQKRLALVDGLEERDRAEPLEVLRERRDGAELELVHRFAREEQNPSSVPGKRAESLVFLHEGRRMVRTLVLMQLRWCAELRIIMRFGQTCICCF